MPQNCSPIQKQVTQVTTKLSVQQSIGRDHRITSKPNQPVNYHIYSSKPLPDLSKPFQSLLTICFCFNISLVTTTGLVGY